MREEPIVIRLGKSARILSSFVLTCAALAQPVHAAGNPAVAEARQLTEREKWVDVYSKLAGVVPTLAPNDDDKAVGQFMLAQALFHLGLYQSSLRSFDAVVVPQNHPLYREKMQYYLRIQRAVPGDLATIERLSDAPEALHRKEDLDEIRFLLGQYYYNVGELDQAIKQLTPVEPKAGELYLKARHLLGVIHVSRFERLLRETKQASTAALTPALEAFKDVLRFEDLIGSPKFYGPYRDLAFLSMGRLFYSVGQYETAGRYYDRVVEGSTAWLDSLFELGWTYFRLNRIDRVLGQLHTLNSPYFEDRYYPEARVLEALIHFRTCRFPETLATVQRFLRDYKPLKKELDLQLAGQRTDAEFYDYLAGLAGQQKTLSVQLRRIFNVALKDRRLQRAFKGVVMANKEMEGLAELEQATTAKERAKELATDMARVRAVMIAEAGGAARTRLTRVREDLTEVIRQGLRIKYETMKARRGSINGQVRKDMEATAKAASDPRADDDEHVVWPFDGSYWRDELGGYTYDTRSKCTDKQFTGGR
jgi:tetratricopeptide (TPR) repeat protein